MNRNDVAIGGIFATLGLSLVISGARFPEGVGRLPGAGFFPMTVGVAATLLAVGLLVTAFSSAVSVRPPLHNLRTLLMAGGLTAAYLLLWGYFGFALRTIVFMVLFLRLLGERWRNSVAVSAAVTAAVVLAFQYGLKIHLQ